MYAVFEEVLGHPTAVDKRKYTEKDVGRVRAMKVTPKMPVTRGTKTSDEMNEGIPHYVACSASDMSRKRHRYRKSINSQYHTKCPKSNKAKDEESTNPLLDTIKVITYDPCDDSDDYYEMGSEEDEDKVTNKDEKVRPQVAGDRESIAYAGSNSIDSGYKSFCPTPEMHDPSAYSRDVNDANSTSELYGSTTISNTSRKPDINKSRSLIGTKFSNRQGPFTSHPKRSDTNLYEVNLDHLMYLRQSLLSAIQKCESSESKCCDDISVGANDTDSVVANVEGTPITNNVAPAYHKTVRFDSDVQVSSDGKKSIKDSRKKSNTLPRRKDSRTQSKSILKDPLCENLRLKLQSEPEGTNLEEEIDSLLYGRAEFYDLESVDDFPCSYVTMIEEKYKNGMSSVAKVRKLKGSKNPDIVKPNIEAEVKILNEAPEETNKFEKTSKGSSQQNSPTATTTSASTRCRFTEVARCMIEIIEDLQLKKLQADVSAANPSTKEEPQQLTNDSNKDQNCLAGSKPDDPTPDTTYISRNNLASDYHVYEEIDYDFLCDNVEYMATEVPPPLPARPTSLFQKNGQHCSRSLHKASPSKRRGRSLKPREDGSVSNRPKQRSNLYSLFSNQADRRSISRSLERESYVTTKPRSADTEDDYGFRKVFPVV